MTVNVSKVVVKDAKGEDKCLGDYQGKVLLIVNVASKCGFTKQYSALQKLQDTYGAKGFEVLAFPCNDFGGQEPGNLEEIQNFCSSNYGVQFSIFDKIHAKGTTTEPYKTLNATQPSGDVEWNFEKFLISKDSQVLKRFKSAVEPDDKDLKAAIENALDS